MQPFSSEINNQKKQNLVSTARLLVTRLEKLSVDSLWARRASGLRGTLLKFLEKMDHMEPQELTTALDEDERTDLEFLVAKSFEILENAAREIRPD